MTNNFNVSNGLTGTNEIEPNLPVNKGGEIQHKNMAGTQLPEQSKSIKTLSAFLKNNHTAEINLDQTYKNALKMLNNAKADKNPTDEKVTALNKHIGLYNDALKKEVENETKAVEELKKALKPIKDDLSRIKEEIPNLLEVAKQRKDNLQKQINNSTSFLGRIINFFAKIFNSKNYVDVQKSQEKIQKLEKNIENLEAVQADFNTQIGTLENTLNNLKKLNTKTESKKHAHVKAHQKPHKEKPADTSKTATEEKSSESETITVNGKTHDKTALPKTPEKISKPKPQEPAADALNEKQVFPANDSAMVTEMKNLKLKQVKEEEMNIYKKGLPKEENTQQIENQEPAATEQQIVPQESTKVQETTEQQVNQQVVVDEKKQSETQEIAADTKQVEPQQVKPTSDPNVPPAPIFKEKAPVQPTDQSQPPAQTSTLLKAIQSSKGALKHTEPQEKQAPKLSTFEQAIVGRKEAWQYSDTGSAEDQGSWDFSDPQRDKFDDSTLNTPTEHQTKKVDLTEEQKAKKDKVINKLNAQKAAAAGQGNFLSELQQGVTLKKTKTEQPATNKNQNTQPLKGNNILASLSEQIKVQENEEIESDSTSEDWSD